MKKINLFILTGLISICFFGCKKKNYKEGKLLFNYCVSYSVQDSTTLNISLLEQDYNTNDQGKIFKVKNETQLDSLIPLAGGMLNGVNLNHDVVYFFFTRMNSRYSECPELTKNKLKINDSERKIEFEASLKGYDGKSSELKLLLGFLIVPKSDEGYSVNGTLNIGSTIGFMNYTGGTNNWTTEYSL